MADAATLNTLFTVLPQMAAKRGNSEFLYLVEGVTSASYPPDTILYQQGQRVTNVYLVVEGLVAEVRAGSAAAPVLMRESAAGMLLGVYDLVNERGHSTSARTRSECTLLIFDAGQFARLLYRFPELRNQLMPIQRMNRLRTIPLVGKLDPAALGFLSEICTEVQWSAGTQIYAAGDPAETIYLIDEGQVELSPSGGDTLLLGNGGEFGLNEDARPGSPAGAYALDHSASAVTPLKAFALPRRQFLSIAGLNPEFEGRKLRRARADVLDQVRIFDNYTPEEKRRLLGYMSYYYLPINYLLTQQGDITESFWVLLPHGSVTVHALAADGTALPDARADGPNYFNDFALRTRGGRYAPSTLEAEAGSMWLRLNEQDFRIFTSRHGGPDLVKRLTLAPAAAAAERGTKRFRWLQPGEEVILLTRAHWIVALRKLSGAIILTVITAALFAFVGASSGSILSLVLTALAALVAVGAWLWGIYDYLNDYLVVTTLRVFAQEKVLLFYEARQTTEVEQVQNVDKTISFWGRVLGYAHIRVQTSGTVSLINFGYVTRAQEISDAIMEQKEARQRFRLASNRKNIFDQLENRYGVVLGLPRRVWPSDDPPRPRKPTLWQRFAASFGNPLKNRDYDDLASLDRIVWHKHWIVLIPALALPVFILLILIAGLIFLSLTGLPGGGNLPAGIVLGVAIGGVLLWIGWQVEDWRNDIYVLQGTQVLDVEREPLALSEKRRIARLIQIVDVSLDMPSFINQIFNYGNVRLQTAATEGIFTFDSVADPRRVVEVISWRIDNLRRADEEAAARRRAAELPDWFEISDRLQGSPRTRPDAERQP